MNTPLIALATILALTTPAAAAADLSTLQTGISVEAASGWLAEHCPDRTDIRQSPTDFPMAETTLHNVHCSYETHATMLSFADDRLIHIETRGEIGPMVPQGDPAMQMRHFDVYPETTTVHDRALNRLIRLNALHDANMLLFWDNPAWSGHAPAANGSQDWILLDHINFGSSIAEAETALEGRCSMMRTRPIEEVWLLTEPTEQVQIDCLGYDIAGYPRAAELIFGDGHLEQMWILIGPADIARARAHFAAIHGEPTLETERYIVFDDWALAIRKDVPEFLVGSEALQAIWRIEGN